MVAQTVTNESTLQYSLEKNIGRGHNATEGFCRQAIKIIYLLAINISVFRSLNQFNLRICSVNQCNTNSVYLEL